MSKKTPFYDLHLKSNAKIVDFAGWDMPLHYGSQLEEHHQVRKHSGMFDVSHMGIVDLKGDDTENYLRYLLANNIDKLQENRALYTCMLNEQGGVIDDLIVYKISPIFYRLVINAGTREKDIAWIKKNLEHFKVDFTERNDLAMLAVQGPDVIKLLATVWQPNQVETIQNLKPFSFAAFDELFIARTGYTGEDGYEMIFPVKDAEKMWHMCECLGIKPCGLGARDTLRLEAGLNLYGSDMDETVTPYEANLACTVALNPADRKFIGREALENQQAAGNHKQLVGLVLSGPGVIRNHQKVLLADNAIGEVTSGGYSPTLAASIALARIPATKETICKVEIRNKYIPAQIVKPPFVRHGKKII